MDLSGQQNSQVLKSSLHTRSCHGVKSALNLNITFEHKITRLLPLLLVLFILNGCNLNYQADYEANTAVEQVFVAENNVNDLIQSNSAELNELTFTAFDSASSIDFKQQKTELLLKIKVLDAPTNITEFTLSIFPKYLDKVSYFNYSNHHGYSNPVDIYRTDSNNNRLFSSQRFAFNIDQQAIHNTHYLLIKSERNRYAEVSVVDTDSYIKADRSISYFFSIIYSIILSLILFNAVFYLYTRDKIYLLYSLYMITTLYSILWQEGIINDLPWLAWNSLGNLGYTCFFIISDATAIWFFYHFMRLDFRHSWLVKIVLLCVLFRLLLMSTAFIQHYLLGGYQDNLISYLFNLSMAISSLLVWVILLVKTKRGSPQAKFLFIAWSIMIFTIGLRLIFAFNPHPDLIWMAHSYELGVMIEGLILAFAMADRTMEFKTQRDVAVHKYTAAERAIREHQLIADFQQEMQELVKNPTFSVDEVNEKTNIKFHLLINRAFPIQNSMIYHNNELTGVCTTGLETIDLELLNFKLNKLIDTNKQQQIERHNITTAKNLTMAFLFIPLNPEEFDNTQLIFGLKQSKPISTDIAVEFKTYCEAAYAVLQQIRDVHQVALAANLDSMTGCHNRASIEKIINASLATASRTTLAYIDLDYLKNINDQYGHDVGDQCIIGFVQLLTKHLLNQAKLGRIGGDEFIAVFSDVDFEACEALLETFIESLAEQRFSAAQITISTSIGLAESRIDETMKRLLNKADAALYQAKAQGRNQLTVYEPGMSTSAP